MCACMDKTRRLSMEEAAAWARFADRIEPLRGRVTAASRREASIEGIPQRRPAPLREAPRALSIGDQPGGLDRASWQKLRGGAMRPEWSLDLHGLTAERA